MCFRARIAIGGAGKLKSPWMGIPIPGERPIVLFTEQVRRALTGVTITDAGVTEIARSTGTDSYNRRLGETVRALEVTYRHGRSGRGRVVFYDRVLSENDQRVLWWQTVVPWAKKQRETRGTKTVRLSGREVEIARQIKRLEKERKQLYLSDHPPIHPLIPMRRESGSVDYLRQSEQRWHNEKPQRKQLARITGMWLKNKLTSTTAYKMLREAGWEVTPVSKLRTHDRDRRPYQDDYWKHLPEFVAGVMDKVARPKDYKHDANEDGTPCTKFTRHARARLEYLTARRQAQTIDNQITALRELAAPALELTEPPATDWKAVRGEQ